MANSYTKNVRLIDISPFTFQHFPKWESKCDQYSYQSLDQNKAQFEENLGLLLLPSISITWGPLQVELCQLYTWTRVYHWLTTQTRWSTFFFFFFCSNKQVSLLKGEQKFGKKKENKSNLWLTFLQNFFALSVIQENFINMKKKKLYMIRRDINLIPHQNNIL